MSPPTNPPKTATRARIALLGCGTVGREVAARLLEDGERLGVEPVKVLVRDARRDRGIDRRLLTDRFDEVLDAAPDLVVEAIGGVEPASGYVERGLAAGIPVVSANKTLIAHRGEALHRTARNHGAALAYEASVCAGVPVLAALRHLEGDRVLSIRGVINGTCNYILTRLGAGVAFEAAVREAQGRGLAEPDPSADITGRDAAEKVCVLAAAAGWPGLRPGDVERQGIEAVTPGDAARARRAGRSIKLVAELDLTGDRPVARVGPVLVARDHPLAGIEGAENGVVIETALAGRLVLRGPGAGPKPTASAVLGDVARLLARRCAGARAPVGERAPSARRHQLHVRAGVTPAHLFELLRSHGAEAEDVEIDASGTSVITRPGPSGVAARLGRALANGAGERNRGLVLPILEPPSRIPA